MKKIILRGPVLSQSGYGHQSRTALRALKFPDRFDIYVLNTPWGATGWQWEDTEERQWIDSIISKTMHYQQQGGTFDISLQVTIPSEWQQLAPYNVGYTAGIETTKISAKWFEGCFRVNKIIVTSNHAKFGLENSAFQATNNQTGQQFVARVETPIEVVNYPVRNFEAKQIDLVLKNDFNFLTIAQWGPRKNLENTLKCFIEEFIDKEVGLVLKVQSINNSLMDRNLTEQRLKELINKFVNGRERKCEIILLHGDLTDEEMTYVYKHPKIKCLYSLTHGEGFGLPLFEAAYNGLPLIAPAWSGQTDFIYMPQKDKKNNKVKETCMIANVSYDIRNIQPEAVWADMLIPESQWAFPVEWHARSQLKDVYKNYAFHKNRALKLQEHILDKFEENKIYKQFCDAIEEEFPILNIEEFLKEENKNLEEVVQYD